MIYFDSAATSFQKPASVAAAMWEALASMSSPGGISCCGAGRRHGFPVPLGVGGAVWAEKPGTGGLYPQCHSRFEHRHKKFGPAWGKSGGFRL